MASNAPDRIVELEGGLTEIVQTSLGSSPEDMLAKALSLSIRISGASGGSILGEEGPYLQFLFSDAPGLIGKRVPYDSIAGATVRTNRVIYTYAPSDKRHFEEVDRELSHSTQYLLSVPIPSVHTAQGGGADTRSAGALQLLFDGDISGDKRIQLPMEFSLAEVRSAPLYREHLRDLFWLLPVIAFGIEVVRLRQTSYQAIHELKNKLIAGLSWVGCLRDDISKHSATALTDSVILEDFSLTESSLREGAELAKTYLQLTKIYSPQFVSASVNAVLDSTAASARALSIETAGGKVAVRTELDPSVPVRLLDESQLKMAFFNLCKNAIEALAAHGTQGACVCLRSVSCGGQTEVVIQDNGPGMPSEIADNLFVPFRTKKEGGTGLGLTITRKVVDVHGGTIRCETGPSGTRFVIRI